MVDLCTGRPQHAEEASYSWWPWSDSAFASQETPRDSCSAKLCDCALRVDERKAGVPADEGQDFFNPKMKRGCKTPTCGLLAPALAGKDEVGGEVGKEFAVNPTPSNGREVRLGESSRTGIVDHACVDDGNSAEASSSEYDNQLAVVREALEWQLEHVVQEVVTECVAREELQVCLRRELDQSLRKQFESAQGHLSRECEEFQTALRNQLEQVAREDLKATSRQQFEQLERKQSEHAQSQILAEMTTRDELQVTLRRQFEEMERKQFETIKSLKSEIAAEVTAREDSQTSRNPELHSGAFSAHLAESIDAAVEAALDVKLDGAIAGKLLVLHQTLESQLESVQRQISAEREARKDIQVTLREQVDSVRRLLCAERVAREDLQEMSSKQFDVVQRGLEVERAAREELQAVSSKRFEEVCRRNFEEERDALVHAAASVVLAESGEVGNQRNTIDNRLAECEQMQAALRDTVAELQEALAGGLCASAQLSQEAQAEPGLAVETLAERIACEEMTREAQALSAKADTKASLEQLENMLRADFARLGNELRQKPPHGVAQALEDLHANLAAMTRSPSSPTHPNVESPLPTVDEAMGDTDWYIADSGSIDDPAIASLVIPELTLPANVQKRVPPIKSQLQSSPLPPPAGYLARATSTPTLRSRISPAAKRGALTSAVPPSLFLASRRSSAAAARRAS